MDITENNRYRFLKRTNNMNTIEQSTEGYHELTVPTKLCDARPMAQTIMINSSVSVKKSDDSFLYYSIEENRKKAILGHNDEDEDKTLGTSVGNNASASFSVQRKTRISFEVHHSLLYGEEILAGDEDTGTANNDLDDLFALLYDLKASADER
mmetsp:Transcript_27872/g.58549  ORF Transcript_27872/g.58549 Transcript_27872/m.58549 type:complete len:153 (+) Transcript_27872:139-597(+)